MKFLSNLTTSWWFVVLGAGIITWFCLMQTRVFGPMFDYGLVIQGSHLMQNGLWPHRDFPCSLQILTFFIAHAFQTIFGVRYLSLGLANLFVGLCCFGVLYVLTRNLVGRWAALMFSLSLALATAGQHGIVWYNTVGAILFVMVVTVAVRMVQSSNGWWILGFFIVGSLSGISKLNFHITAMASVAVLMLYKTVLDSNWRRGFLWLGLLGATGLSGPILEIIITNISPMQWVNEIVRASGGRVNDIWMLLSTPRALYTFFLGIPRDFYPAPWSRALPTFFLLTYFLAWRQLTQRHWGLLLFLTCLSLSMIPNILPSNEILILRASFLMSGLIGLALLEPWNLPLRKILSFASIYLAIISTLSVFRHSRLSFEPIEGPFTAGKELHSYFWGTRVDSRRAREIGVIKNIVDRGYGNSGSVYFGPGTNYLYGPFGGSAVRKLPLWWDIGSSYHAEEAPALADDFFSNQFELVTFNEWGFSLPKIIHDRLGDGYESIENDAKNLKILISKKRKTEISSR